MLAIYRERNNIDSIVRFSQLYEDAQDTLHNQMQTSAIHQMSALYNYNRSEKIATQEAEKARQARQWTGIVLFSALVALILILCIYYQYRLRKQQEIHQLQKALSTAETERRGVQDELKRLKDKDYEGLIAEKERKEEELTRTIAELKAQTGNVAATDHLEDFTTTQIAHLFAKKAALKTERPIPSETEWKLLTNEFCNYMPVTFDAFGKRKLSSLEQRTCILLLLDFPESTIVKMTESSSPAISTAKARANHKLFGEKGANSLKNNLKGSTKGH